MELGALSQLLEKLPVTGAAYSAQIVLTIDGAVKRAEEPDEGNLQVRLYVQRWLKCSAGD
jgi:hypothetical protein